MLLRSMQKPQALADAKAENDALRDDVAAGRRRLHIKASLSISALKPPPPPAWIMQPPPNPVAGADLLPQREADHYAKTTGRNPESILMSSADGVALIDGQLIQLL